jgi:cysteine synthase A
MGFKTRVFLPDDLAQEKYDQLTLLKADLIKVRPVSIVDKNHFCRLAEDRAAEDGTACSYLLRCILR